MQVNVFISESGEGRPPQLLVLPLRPEAAIPPHLQGLDWRHFATTMTDDKLLGAPASTIEAEIAKSGYALVSPTF